MMTTVVFVEWHLMPVVQIVNYLVMTALLVSGAWYNHRGLNHVDCRKNYTDCIYIYLYV